MPAKNKEFILIKQTEEILSKLEIEGEQFSLYHQYSSCIQEEI